MLKILSLYRLAFGQPVSMSFWNTYRIESFPEDISALKQRIMVNLAQSTIREGDLFDMNL